MPARPGGSGRAPSVEPSSRPRQVVRGGRSDGALARLFSAPGGQLLLLRAFLGFTFTFAGLQKLANPGFFRTGAPGSFNQQLLGAMITSPIRQLLVIPSHAPTFFAVVIALGEVGVGLGTLVGLLSRLAGLGGMLLSLSFFLTISWTATPYYYGADIVFFFAWTPLAIGGAGAWSLDALIAAGRERSAGAARVGGRLVGRREAIAGLTVVALVAAGVDSLIGRAFAPKAKSAAVPSLGGKTGSGQTTSTNAASGATSTTQPAAGGGAVPKGTKLGNASQVPVGGAGSFTDPAQGVPAFVVQPEKGTFRAFSAVCTHAGCTVEFDKQNEAFVCPCHGSVFSAATGAVMQGPAPSPLPAIKLALGPNNELYVDG
ncbi:MAG: Rieske (2Fe-2S) domain protein [Acidimicrobiaceae bacterium]|nr:Rieske (2Fe-2S) domain protein [Acidimicrobiaceae bacterium]